MISVFHEKFVFVLESESYLKFDYLILLYSASKKKGRKYFGKVNISEREYSREFKI